ncbi:serine/threonine phosphatase [Pleurocapsales cyanobacterium LEGE 06147]|nr:serine/threonine phosphatase [Pleurocapsales cyanobacterium LEGE 06147]
MLICPQCQFENPDTNNYCQNCGTSLTDKTCPQCNANIPIQAEQCDRCGAFTGTLLWAILTKEPAAEKHREPVLPAQRAKSLTISELSDSSLSQEKSELFQAQITARYLDRDQRYRIDLLNNSKEKIVESNWGESLVQVRVIDCQPLQKSYLSTCREQHTEFFAQLERDFNISFPTALQSCQQLGIPIQALPYLMLQNYTPIVPEIYDTWQQDDRGVVLLPDRSQWQLLVEVWTKPEISLLPILWSLDKMAMLWGPLCQINCGKSLLVKTNLRVDEDQSLYLQQLYTADFQPSLADLAKTWQLWLSESGQEVSQIQVLDRLLKETIGGKIETVEELRSHLQQIAANVKDESDRSAKMDLDFFVADDEELIDESDSEEQPTLMIPMRLAGIADAGCTDVGSQRDRNEDFFCIHTNLNKQENPIEKTFSVRGLYIVCDGMGGHAAGEIASAMAVETLEHYFQAHWQGELPNEATIKNGILYTNQALYQNNLHQARSGSGRMGTTLVMALVQDLQVAIAHVGDSRIYQITRQRGLEQLTSDHEVGQREINRGVEPEIAYTRPDAYQLTQALGPRDNNYVRPEIKYLDIKEDTLLLLCSDGLCDRNLVENYWQTHLAPLISSSADLQEGLFQLIDLANNYNGHDNITGILVRIKLRPTL